ncbi:DUF2157 domain-containing protein [Maricaulis parjimensis]|uniref:DUF2157 domain-containing protein n=1 Tax=Maricaulis parjimensis TaxID=144023 RepID=UPI00193A15EA|nr:DUF2157 domain-containing protein [Maricaulis parjimensis]
MGYLSRLAKDLDHWIEQGWVEASRRETILADAGSQTRHWTAIGALSILGAVLLALSALTFMAANWESMPRLLRSAVILAALWLSLVGAGQAFDRKAPALGHALAILGIALFGVAILLTAQTFNMASFRNTAVLIWSLAGLVTALVLPSRPVLILAALLGALWAGLEIFNPFVGGVIWTYLPLWLATLALAVRLHSPITLHLLAAALVLWVANAVFGTAPEDAVDVSTLQTAAVLTYGALALGAAVARDRGVTGGGILTAWLAVVTVTMAITLQFHIDGDWADNTPFNTGAYLMRALPALLAILGLAAWRVRSGHASVKLAVSLSGAALVSFALPFLLETALDGIALRLILGVLIYAACVGLILQGSQEKARATGVIGICAFIGQTLYVYAETFGGLLDTALFFLVGGLILFGFSLGLMRWRAVRARDGEGVA